MKPKTVKPIDPLELENLSTKRILSYLKKLQQCEDGPELSDWTKEEVSKVDGIVYKSSREWIIQHQLVKSVLATRPHIVDG